MRLIEKLVIARQALVVTSSLAMGFTCFISSGRAAAVQTVFVIAMENHNWTQPDGNVTSLSSIQQLKGNPNAPFLNSLVNGTASAIINGVPTNLSAQTAYADTYHNVLANAAGSVHIHPSEPSYIWAEAGTNFGVLDDNDPYAGNNQNTNQHLTGYLNAKGISWKSYQEDIDTDSAGNVLPQNQWVSPIHSNSGTYTTVPNVYNGSLQYDYAAKHNPMIFFSDTNGGNDSTPSNPAATFYAPLQQLQIDLTANTAARYNWITPNQFNDMHSSLSGGYDPLDGSPHVTDDAAQIRQGDDFLSLIVPQIMASAAYQNNGAILLWWDETEDQGGADNADDLNHTIPEIVISPLAHPNVGGLPYHNSIYYTHSSDLLTMQEIFQVGPPLGDAANANDLSDLFASGAIPAVLPEPGSLGLLAIGSAIGGLGLLHRRRSRLLMSR
jgi:hypothetical protein